MGLMIPAAIDPRWRLKRRKALTYNVPAPTGGLNARDSLTDMKPGDAVRLTNVFPEANSCVVRGGYAPWSTTMAAPVRSLMTWNGLTGVDKLFSAAGTTIWNSSASGAAVADVTGLTNADWQWTNIKTPGGIFLMAVNGADSMRSYDGSAWAIPVITGPLSSTFANVWQFKERLWFTVVDSLDLYYLAPQSIAGAATVFPLGSVFRRGGFAMAGGSFSNDAGEGPDDFMAVISNNGEVVVYQGTDPSSTNTWALVGRFDVGMPIGRRCAIRLNGDLGFITQDGVISMQAALRFDRASIQKAAITGKIQTLFSQFSQSYKANFGWSPCIFPKTRYMIVNVPQITNGTQIQLVMNTLTGQWCQFVGMNAGCWGVANDLLYFGGNDGVTYQADNGRRDNGSLINWQCMPAWQMRGGPANKFYTMVRPNMLVGSGVQYGLAINVDFLEVAPTGGLPPISTGLPSMVWPWTWPGVWGGASILDNRWQSTGAIGTWATINHVGTISDGACTINSYDVICEPGGPL